MLTFRCPSCGQNVKVPDLASSPDVRCDGCGTEFQVVAHPGGLRVAAERGKSIEQAAADLARYPIDAFAFVQEGLGFAAEQVHGPKSQNHRLIERWMDRNDVDLAKLYELHDAGKLPKHVVVKIRKLGGVSRLNRHVSGQQLCWGLRDLALQKWGLMASSVLKRWNIASTADFGRIVFALVNNGCLQKQPSDSPEDFKDVYDFAEAFDGNFRIPKEQAR